MKTIDKDWENLQKNKYRNLSEEDKNNKKEYGKIDIIICLKKKKKTETKSLSKKLTWGKKVSI